MKFRPDDRVLDIYGTTAAVDDGFQLETLLDELVDRYATFVDLSDKELTLGQVFAATRQ